MQLVFISHTINNMQFILFTILSLKVSKTFQDYLNNSFCQKIFICLNSSLINLINKSFLSSFFLFNSWIFNLTYKAFSQKSDLSIIVENVKYDLNILA